MRRDRSLKKRTVLVRDVMSPIVATVSLATPLDEAAELFASKGLLGAPVVDASGRVLGALTELDINLFVRREFRGLPRFRFITWRARVRNMLRSLERRHPVLASQIHAKLRTTKTSEVLDRNRPIARPGDEFGAIGRYMLDTKTILVPVIEDGRVIGTVGYDAVARVVYQGLAEVTSG
ncbi:MAG: CBS domain-containing protein [Thermoplasmata archaeon]